MEPIIVSENNKNFKLVIVGAGGTGSHLISFITQVFSNNRNVDIVVVDADTVESKNTRNQKFLPGDVGKAKAEVLVDRYKRVYPQLNIQYDLKYIKSIQDLYNYYEYSYNYITILIGCVDNDSTRKIFNDYFYNNNTKELIYIDSGNGTNDRIGQVVTGYKTYKYPNHNYWDSSKETIIKLQPASYYFDEILNNKDDINKVLSCAYTSDEFPQHIGTNITAATSILQVLINIIMFNQITNNISYFDVENNSLISR